MRFGLSWTVAAEMALLAGLVCLAVIDLDRRLLPRRVLYPTAATVLVSGGNAPLSIGAAITQTNAARAIDIQNRTGGAVTFSGAISATGSSTGAILNANGGHAEILQLPSVGLRGNTHIAFADLNNVEVADQLSLFLKKNRLDLR